MPAPRLDVRRRPAVPAGGRRHADLQQVGPLDRVRSLRSAAPQSLRGFRAAAPGGAAARGSAGAARTKASRTPQRPRRRALCQERNFLLCERPPPTGSTSSSSLLLLLSEPCRPLPGRAQPREPSPRASAACEVAGPRPSDRQPGAGAGSFLAPPGRGGRAGGGEQPRLGRAQGGSGWARPRWLARSSRRRRGTAARGWSLASGGRRSAERLRGRHRLGRAEPSGCGGRGPACRPDSRVGVPGRRSVRCARTLPAAAPLPRPPGRSGLAAAAGSPEPPKTPAARRGGPSARV